MTFPDYASKKPTALGKIIVILFKGIWRGVKKSITDSRKNRKVEYRVYASAQPVELLSRKIELKDAFQLPTLVNWKGEELVVKDTLVDAVNLIYLSGKCSTTMLQHHLKLGYKSASDIVDHMESLGLVCPANGGMPRDINIEKIKEFQSLLPR